MGQQKRREPPRQAVSFTVERVRDGYFVPILYDSNGQVIIRHATCGCLDQAVDCATRSLTRPLRYDGMRGWSKATQEMSPVDDDMRCSCDPRSWVWQLHHHTHGALARLRARQAA